MLRLTLNNLKLGLYTIRGAQLLLGLNLLQLITIIGLIINSKQLHVEMKLEKNQVEMEDGDRKKALN